MGEQNTPEVPKQNPTKITLDQTTHFVREGFEGWKYPDGLMMISVHGNHPRKRIETGERRYTVAHIEGDGEFTLNGETSPIKQGDKYILPAGAEYSYHGTNMTLIEENKEGTSDSLIETQDESQTEIKPSENLNQGFLTRADFKPDGSIQEDRVKDIYSQVTSGDGWLEAYKYSRELLQKYYPDRADQAIESFFHGLNNRLPRFEEALSRTKTIDAIGRYTITVPELAVDVSKADAKILMGLFRLEAEILHNVDGEQFEKIFFEGYKGLRHAIPHTAPRFVQPSFAFEQTPSGAKIVPYFAFHMDSIREFIPETAGDRAVRLLAMVREEVDHALATQH